MSGIEDVGDKDSINLDIRGNDILRSHNIRNINRLRVVDHDLCTLGLITLFKTLKSALGLIQLIEYVEECL
jgi:hypothetical protein